MDYPKNKKQLISKFNALPKNIRSSFADVPTLVEGYNWDVPISYVFSRIEAIKHTTLYCGLVKRHWTETSITRSLLDKEHITRGRFRELFKVVFDKPISPEILEKLASAEAVRDKVAHGKRLTEPEARQCLTDALLFATEFSKFVKQQAGFCPFSDLRGFKGRAEPLTKETTRWVLRGMGIPPASKRDSGEASAN